MGVKLVHLVRDVHSGFVACALLGIGVCNVSGTTARQGRMDLMCMQILLSKANRALTDRASGMPGRRPTWRSACCTSDNRIHRSSILTTTRSVRRIGGL